MAAVNNSVNKSDTESKPSASYIHVGNSIQVDHRQCLRESHLIFKGVFHGEEIAVKRIAFTEKSKREVEDMARLKNHPNTVQYKSYAEWESVETPGLKFIYIAMELCDGSTLFELAEDESFRYRDRIASLLQVMLGLSHIHNNGIVHGDLRANKVLRSLDGSYFKIVDFGLNKSRRGTRTQVGTYGWTAPDKDLTEKSDIYSTGLVFYHVLSAGKYDNVIDPGNLDCPDSEIASDLIRSMLEFNPDDRPTARAILNHPLFWEADKRLAFYTDIVDSILKIPGDGAQHLVDAINSAEGAISDKNWVDILLSDEKASDRVSQIVRTVIQNMQKDGGCFTEFAHAEFTATYDSNSPFNLILLIVRSIRQLRGASKPGSVEMRENERTLWSFFSDHLPKLFPQVYHVIERLAKQVENNEVVPRTDWSSVRCYFDEKEDGQLDPIWTDERQFQFLSRISTDGQFKDFYEDKGSDIFDDNWIEKLALSKSERMKCQNTLEESGSKMKIEKWAIFNRAAEPMQLEETEYNPKSVQSLLKFMTNLRKYLGEDSNQVKAIFGNDNDKVWEFFVPRFPQLFQLVRGGVSKSPLYGNILARIHN